MKIKPLNLDGAIKLAYIIGKYVDINSVSPETDAIDFINDIVEKISPEDYIRCVMLMTNKTEEDVKREVSINVLDAFICGLQENRIVSLLEFFKSIGKQNGDSSRLS